MVGAGTLITCSWQPLSSPMRTVVIVSDLGLSYRIYPALGVNEGFGLLTDTVGWLGEDRLFVYINTTEMRHMSTYKCFVRTVDDYQLLSSNRFELIVNGKNMLNYGITSKIPVRWPGECYGFMLSCTIP